MRVATIDLGTNAVRFDVHRLGPGGELTRLHRERLMVRLGQGVFGTRRLVPPAMERTIAAFKSFRHTCDDLRVDKITAYGTSALREAANSDVFLRRLERVTGIEVHVISGAEEARLIAQGILRGEAEMEGLSALVDIGGGSAELTLCRDGRVVRSSSFDLGASRLQQLFLKAVPPRGNGMALQRLRANIQRLLEAGSPRGGWPRVDVLVGSGGGIGTLLKVHRAQDGEEAMTPGELRRLTERLAPLGRRQLLRLPGMDPKRVDMILACAVVLDEITRAVDPDEIRATDFALRDGMIEEERRLYRGTARAPIASHRADIDRLADRLGIPDAHRAEVTAWSLRLFDRLAPLHRLSGDWRDYLVAAALLQDTGESISPVHPERHASYVARHMDVPALAEWEKEFVAQLCLWHKPGKVDGDEVPFWAERGKRLAFMKLLALLRLVDALDRRHAGRVRERKLRLENRRLSIDLVGDPLAAGLEVMRLEQKKDLFEATFRVGLMARALPNG